MRIVVALKQIPDLVEELELAPGGTDLDRELLKFVLNEFDEQALEEALCIKESDGAEVVVVGFDEPDVDQSLFTALAKGADRAVKLAGAGDGWLDGHSRAAMLASWLGGEPFDLVLTGVQAADDLDGQLPSLLGAGIGLPHVSVVMRVEPKGASVRVWQEFAGGVLAEEDVQVPAVIGVQAARQAPRYVSISRIRQAQQEGTIEEAAVSPPAPADGGGYRVRRLLAPESSGHAEMLGGSAADVAGRIVEIIRAKGLVKA